MRRMKGQVVMHPDEFRAIVSLMRYAMVLLGLNFVGHIVFVTWRHFS